MSAAFRIHRACAFAALGAAFMVAFFHRVAPTVIAQDLMASLDAGALALGWLAAAYFYVYTAMQIPAGILADRVGPRLSVAGGSVVAAAGSLLFALAPGLGVANLGRLVVGLGVATAFVGMMKFNAAWYAPRQYGSVSGLVVLWGNVGAVFGTAPLAWVLGAAGWRPVFVGVAAVSLIIALAIALVVRDSPAAAGYRLDEPRARPRLRRSWTHDLAVVAADKRLWPYAIGLFTILGSFFAFTGLWAVPMLDEVYALDTSRAAGYVTAALVAFALGSFAAGWISDRWGRRKPVIVAAASATTATYLATLLLPWGPGAGAWLLFVAHGLAASAMVVCYTGAKESAPPQATGMAIAFVNTGLFLGAAVLQPAFGALLALDGGPRDAADYGRGLWLLVVVCAAGVAAVAMIRETGETRSP